MKTKTEYVVEFLPYISEDYPDTQGHEIERFSNKTDATDRLFEVASSDTVESCSLLEVTYANGGWASRSLHEWESSSL